MQQSAAPAAEAGPATLTIESWRNDDLAIWQDVIIPAFNAHYPDIEVSLCPRRPGRVQRRPQRQAGRRHRRRPDHLPPLRPSLALFEQGNLASLNDLPGLENFGDVAKSAWVTDDGSDVFCVPMASVIHGFIYNADIFAELGLEEPATEAEFFELLEAIKADGTYDALVMGTADQWEAATMGFQNIGPNYWKGEEGSPGSDRRHRKATPIPSMWHPGISWPSGRTICPTALKPRPTPTPRTSSPSGQAAIYPAGSWDIALFNEQADFEMGAFRRPCPKGADTCYISDHTDIALGMNPKTENPEAAKAFLAVDDHRRIRRTLQQRPARFLLPSPTTTSRWTTRWPRNS